MKIKHLKFYNITEKNKQTNSVRYKLQLIIIALMTIYNYYHQAIIDVN